MTNGFALWMNDARSVGWGELSLNAAGRLALRGETGSADVALDPSTAPYVDVYVDQDWLCAVGGADTQLVVGHASGPRLEVAAELERGAAGSRLEFRRHSVRFYDRPGHAQCVLAWELGVCLVDREAGLLWSHMHRDLNQRLIKITDETVQLRGTHQVVSLAMTDGTAQVENFAAPPVDGGEAFAEWMRGIGR